MWCWQDVGNKMKGSMTLFPVCCVMSRVLRGGIFHGMCSNNRPCLHGEFRSVLTEVYNQVKLK